MPPHSIIPLVVSILLHQLHPSLSSLIPSHGKSRSLLPIFKETLDSNQDGHEFAYQDYQAQDFSPGKKKFAYQDYQSQDSESANSRPVDPKFAYQDYQSQDLEPANSNPDDQKFAYQDYQSQDSSIGDQKFAYQDYQSQDLKSANSDPGDQKIAYQDYQETSQKYLDLNPDDQTFPYLDYQSPDLESKNTLAPVPSHHQFAYHDYQSAYVEDESTARLDPNVEYVDAAFDYPDFDFNPPEGLSIPGIDLENIDRKALLGSLQPGGWLGTLLSLQQNPTFGLALGGLAAFGGYVSYVILSQVGVFNAAYRIIIKMGRVLFGSDNVNRMRRKREVDNVAMRVIEALEKFNENFSN